MAAVTQSSSSTISTSSRSQSQAHIDIRQVCLSDEEMAVLLGFIEVVTTLVKWVKLLIISHPSLEPELYQIAARTAIALEKVHPDGKILQGVSFFCTLVIFFLSILNSSFPIIIITINYLFIITIFFFFLIS